MAMKSVACLWLLVLCLGLAAANAETNLLAPGATLQKLSGGFAFTEGPACDREGNVFFTDQPNDRIMKWGVDGRLTTFKQPCGRANGLSFDREGNLWACADGKNELWKISGDGKEVTVVLKGLEGKLFNGPNDLWIAPVGAKGGLPGIYFTDPFYKRAYWERGPKEMPESVYYLGPGAKMPVRVIDDLKQPNGIIGSPDGKTLYVADIGANKTYRYSIGPEGRLGAKALFCGRGSDGLTIDSEGNVYTTSRGVFVYSPAGAEILHIEIPEPWTANVCFGGADRQTLFITASKGLYSIGMRTRGVDSQ